MKVFKNGAPAGEAPGLDIREGVGVTLAVVDEPANGTSAITFDLSGSITAPGTNDIVFTAGGAERGRIAHDGTITGLASATTAPTNSELVSSVFYISGITSTINIGLFVAPFACKLAAIALVTAEDHAQSDTNYHTYDVFKQPGNLLIASKNTKLTGGFPITQWTDWNFDAVAFDATNQLLAKGDFVRVRITPTGAPVTITGLTITLRYEPT